MALFESYERRIDQINAVLNSYAISSLEEAEKIIKEQSLFVGEITKIEVPGLEKNIVVDTSISAGSRVSAGSNINLIISR